VSLKDISRMPKKYRDRMLHVMQPPERPDYIGSLSEKPEQRKALYGKFGRRSGVEPGVMWPSEEELNDIIEFEKEWEPSVQRMWAKSKEEKELEQKERCQKRELVEKQMAKMPEYINQYRAKLAKADEAERKQQEKRKALVDEAREYFGYDLDPRDPRFEQMQLKKEEEEKNLKKKKKKEDKLAKLSHLMK